MTAQNLNHVSIVAEDLDESVAFYRDIFGMEEVPAPTFEVPVTWLECGEQQLHLFERDVEAPAYHHFGVTVDDFEAVYETAREQDLFDRWDDESSASVYSLPDGSVQLYARDPAGNLVEINWPNVETLPESIRETITPRDELITQTGEAARATLGLSGTDLSSD